MSPFSTIIFSAGKVRFSKLKLRLPKLWQVLENGHKLRSPLQKHRKNTQIHGRPDSIPADTDTCNSDAAWRKESSKAGLSWIFDYSSQLLASSGCKTQDRVSSALMAEGLAVREALLHAKQIGINKIWLRSDYLSLVKAINSVSKPMNLYGILSDIESLYASFNFCCIFFVQREENGPADKLSKACLLHSVSTWSWGHWFL